MPPCTIHSSTLYHTFSHLTFELWQQGSAGGPTGLFAGLAISLHQRHGTDGYGEVPLVGGLRVLLSLLQQGVAGGPGVYQVQGGTETLLQVLLSYGLHLLHLDRILN